MEARHGEVVREHVHGIVPRAAGDEALTAGRIRHPLLDVAGHVVRAVWAQATRMTVHGLGAAAPEVRAMRDAKRGIGEPPRHDDRLEVRVSAVARYLLPLEDGRKSLPGELGVGRGLVPRHTGNRMPRFVRRELLAAPAAGTGQAGPIDEKAHGFAPGDRSA